MRTPDVKAAVAACAAILAALAWSAPAAAQQSNNDNTDAHDWNGFYGGVNAGGAFGGSDFLSALGSGLPCLDCVAYPDVLSGNPNVIAAYSSNRADLATFVGGVQFGWNWWSNNLLFGLEADANYMPLRKSLATSAFGYPNFTNPGGVPLGATLYNFNGELSTDWLVTLRPRIGTGVGDGMLFLTGGLALTELSYKHSMTSSGGAFGSMTEDSLAKDLVAGWTVGAGYEFPLSKNMSLKAEYLFVNFGNVSSDNNKISPLGAVPNLVGTGAAINAASDSIACDVDTKQVAAVPQPVTPRQCFNNKADLFLHMLRLGVNYKF